MFENSEFDNHEMVSTFYDQTSGLKAIIAIHNTTLGPGFGGCRVFPYSSFEDAMTDVLRLSKGMTYKNAAAGVRYGGGKSVIISNPNTPITEQQRLAFAGFVERLCGQYITAEDVGTTTADVAIMERATSYIRNLPLDDSGRPAPFTARGIFCGLEAGWNYVKGQSLKEVTVAVEGLGAVGMELCRLLDNAGAKLIVVDCNENLCKQAQSRFGAEIGILGKIHSAEADIYSPCALGGTLSEDTIPDIKAEMIAGGANNQLKKTEDGYRLFQRNITYCPDYLINAGGVLSVAKHGEKFDSDIAYQRASSIGERITDALTRSKEWNVPPHIAADRMAENILSR